MRKRVEEWWSPQLGRRMPVAVYGHFGVPILLFPTAMADFLEYERFRLIEVLWPWIEQGVCKLYTINSINADSWLHPTLPPRERILRHMAYNRYVVQEVVPFIVADCQGPQPIITSGASLGAFHAANLFFQRPDIFAGTIALSGVYDLQVYSNGYFDDDCYFNSPIHFLPNLNDDYWLPLLRQRRHIYLACGRGAYERPEATLQLSAILSAKGIPHTVEVWGPEWPHDWQTWRAMMPRYVERLRLDPPYSA
ncbi:MAG: esterase [Chlorobiota bacterium]